MVLASVTGGIILLDQLTKQQIMQTMRLHESIPVIPNLFSLTYIRNPGAAFGLLAGSSNAFRMVFFGLTSIFALGLLGTILLRMPEEDWMGRVSVAAILGGAIGNLIEIKFGARKRRDLHGKHLRPASPQHRDDAVPVGEPPQAYKTQHAGHQHQGVTCS